MDSPTLSSSSSVKRSPFVPVKRHRVQMKEDLDSDSRMQENAGSSSSGARNESGHASARPPVVPLTTSNLHQYTAALYNAKEQQPEVLSHHHQHQRSSSSKRTSKHDSILLGDRHTDSLFPPPRHAPASPALSSTSSSQNNNITNNYNPGSTAAALRTLGHGLPSRHASDKPSITSSMLSAKRYTRQIASEQQVSPPSNNNDHVLSASNLRARSRLTSGSAPRKKAAVPGAERADHATPSSSFTSISSASSYARPASACSVRTPSRPPSRSGGSSYDGPTPSRSVSRPQSRMGEVPPDLIISASSVPVHAEMRPGHSRRDSTSSVGTVIQRRQENVLVCVRVRPPAVSHLERNVNPAHLEEAWMASSDTGSIALADGSGHQYRFDALVTGSGNENVYQVAASDLIRSAMNGYDAVIFAYGQTASGKTFTLSGTQTNPGIIPQAVSDIFQYIRAHPKKEFLLRASYLEIYNEQLKDLLAPETAGQVKIRQDERKRFFVSPLREEVVTTEAHVSQLLLRGETNRHTGSTDYNARSSRSHAVFQIVIESRDIHNGPSGTPVGRVQIPGRSGFASDDRAVVTSRLSLIDLAGSEKATSQADRRVEGAFINKSLLTLEKVIAALTEEKSRAHVPYRDSKLTQILQPSLSGEARVAVICTVNPSPVAIQESTSTLKFAQRVKKVTLNAERNEVVGEKALIIRYEQTIAEMTAYIAQLEHAQVLPQDNPSHEQETRGARQHSNRNVSNPEVLKAKEDRAKLQGFIVTAGNLDEQRAEGPRPVTPMRPVSPAQLPLIQEQLLDSQDRIAELEELCEKQQDELASLKAQLAAKATGEPGSSLPDSAFQALQARNEELERQCREYRTILANEDQVTALRSERRLAAREWSDKLVQLQQDLDKSRGLHLQAMHQLTEEQQKTRRLEKTLLKSGIHSDAIKSIDSSPDHSISTSMIGLDLLSAESPMLDIQGSYLNLDEILDSPLSTPVRARR